MVQLKAVRTTITCRRGFLATLLVAILTLPASASATLILIVPTRDGIVIAADSRVTITYQNNRKYEDGATKVHFVATQPPIAFAFAGNADFPKSPPPAVGIAQSTSSMEYHFRSIPAVEKAITSLSSTTLNDAFVKTVAGALAKELTNLFAADHDLRKTFSSAWVSKFFLVQSHGATLLVGRASLSADAAGVVRVTEADALQPIAQDDPFEPHVSTDYVKHVLGGVGRQFLPPGFSPTLGGRRVRDVTPGDAVRYVRTIVQATEATTRLVPFGNNIGIGGPVKGYLVKTDSVVSLEDVR